jgi:hypothetical protein
VSATLKSSGLWDVQDRAEVLTPALRQDATDLEYQQALARMPWPEQNRWVRTMQTAKAIERVVGNGLAKGLTT